MTHRAPRVASSPWGGGTNLRHSLYVPVMGKDGLVMSVIIIVF